MIGLIQKLVLQMVEEIGGPEALLEVKRRTSLPEEFEFRIDTDYDNEQMQQILENACAVLQVSEEAALSAFADYFLRDAQNRFPVFIAQARTSRELLIHQTTIHNMLGSGLRNAEKLKAINDKFQVIKHDNGDLEVLYRSPNQWCTLYRKLAEAVAELYQENMTLSTIQCRKRGDQHCAFLIHWPEHADQ
jgi:Heme NO binding.